MNRHVLASQNARQHSSHLPLLGLSALGVVFGDIGTSPLYTFKTVLALADKQVSPTIILGLISLLFWTLIIVTSIKYVSFAMRLDNGGEGGILALMSILGIKKQQRPLVAACGLFGAALLYGDGAITPAISVLSALEGVTIIFPHAQHYVLPITVIILLLLFAIQPMGTAKIGKIFGPIMALWFFALALLGIRGIIQHPAILAAINPLYGLEFLFSNGYVSFLVLGGIFLCVTGAEALYADMGHFGVRPIRMVWFWLVFPCLLLNYAGQGALVLSGADISGNIFYRLCPPLLLIPLVILATLATIIASQAIITGTFSITRQAIQLGWLPRLGIKQTSQEGYGQIYVGIVNWLLMIVTLGLVLLFKSSDRLAAAYGIAISCTMLLTTLLLFIAMREVWKWRWWASVIAAGSLLLVDVAFLAANFTKVLDGGYIPLLLACVIYTVMLIWHRGVAAVSKTLYQHIVPVHEFLHSLKKQHITRVPGLAIFLTRMTHATPPVMRWHVRRNHALHEKLIVLHVITETIPWVSGSKRLEITEVHENFWRVHARYGFMQQPNIPLLLKRSELLKACHRDLPEATYYLGRETIMHQQRVSKLPKWQSSLFALMVRNSTHISDVFQLPEDQVVEIGRQVVL